MATFTPPTFSRIVPRVLGWNSLNPSTPLQSRLYRYMRPYDGGVNVYVLSDNTVVADYPVVLSDASLASTNIPYPWNPAGSPLVGPPEGAEGGPYGVPPPYAEVWEWIGASTTQYQKFVLSPYVKYWFAGGHAPYVGISANLVTILTAAKFDNYIT